MKEESPFVHITKDTPLKDVLEFGKECKQRDHCCQFGGGFVIKEDIPRIAVFLGVKEDELKEKYLNEATHFNTTLHRDWLEENTRPKHFVQGGAKANSLAGRGKCKSYTSRYPGKPICFWRWNWAFICKR